MKELFTVLIGKNTIYHKKNTDSKIIDIANCQPCKNQLLAVVYMILISHYYQTAQSRLLHESIDGPAGRPADNPPNPVWLGDFHQTVPELTIRVYLQSGLPVWQQFSLDLDLDP